MRKIPYLPVYNAHPGIIWTLILTIFFLKNLRPKRRKIATHKLFLLKEKWEVYKTQVMYKEYHMKLLFRRLDFKCKINFLQTISVNNQGKGNENWLNYHQKVNTTTTTSLFSITILYRCYQLNNNNKQLNSRKWRYDGTIELNMFLSSLKCLKDEISS